MTTNTEEATREALIDDLSATVEWLKRTDNLVDADRVMRAIAALRVLVEFPKDYKGWHLAFWDGDKKTTCTCPLNADHSIQPNPLVESPTDEDTVTDAEVEAAWAGFLSASHDPHQLASENVRRYVRAALEAARRVRRVVSVPPTPTGGES